MVSRFMMYDKSILQYPIVRVNTKYPFKQYFKALIFLWEYHVRSLLEYNSIQKYIFLAQVCMNDSLGFRMNTQANFMRTSKHSFGHSHT